jgi:serine/threonine-protein kinase
MIFWAFGFPYLLVVIMAYVGARVVYALGAEVTRARELGSYRLESRLGAGGMGEVWKASHRLLARPAAIKLIRASASRNIAGSSDDVQRRFEREAQVIAQLRSPHTVTLFDFGIADDGSFYYVMELLDGLDADALIKRAGPFPPNGPCTFFDRCAIRCPRPRRAGSSIATSNRQTSSCAAMARTTTS